MRFFLPFLSLLILGFSGFPQNTIEGTIHGYPHENLILLEYFGDDHRFADSVRTDGNGWFSFEMPPSAKAGLYSLAIGTTPLFNIIFNHEDIRLKFDLQAFSMPEFIESGENLIYYDYLFRSDNYYRKSDLLVDMLLAYPERGDYWEATRVQFYKLQKEHREYTDRLLQEYPNTFVAHIVRSDRPVEIPPDFAWDDYLLFMRKHYLEETDFSDSLLLNTNVLTGKTIDYLGFYSGENIDKEQQERLFIQAVDTILNKAMDNAAVFDYLMQYLIDGFEMYGFDRVISHIAGNYEPASSCVNEERKSELQKRVENLREMAVGKTAPDIIIPGPDGEDFRFEDIDSERTLVVFWASWCPHCTAMIPDLIDLYNDPTIPGFEVLAISLDTSATDYNRAQAEFSMPWINYAELNGWNSKAAIDYNIYATPSMFLLDRKRTILARPVNIYDIKKAIVK